MAETAGAEDERNSIPSEENECKVCFNYFDLDRRIPKLLNCSHTFCQECLQSLHSLEGHGWRIGCPLCRHRTPLREYQVQNLPDNVALTGVLPLRADDIQLNTEAQAAPSGSSQDSSERCETCHHVAFTVGCVCANLSFLSMMVLLFLGLVFVHNFDNTKLPLGSISLLVAGILALLSLIITWSLCLLKYRADSEASSPSSLTAT